MNAGRTSRFKEGSLVSKRNATIDWNLEVNQVAYRAIEAIVKHRNESSRRQG